MAHDIQHHCSSSQSRHSVEGTHTRKRVRNSTMSKLGVHVIISTSSDRALLNSMHRPTPEDDGFRCDAYPHATIEVGFPRRPTPFPPLRITEPVSDSWVALVRAGRPCGRHQEYTGRHCPRVPAAGWLCSPLREWHGLASRFSGNGPWSSPLLHVPLGLSTRWYSATPPSRHYQTNRLCLICQHAPPRHHEPADTSRARPTGALSVSALYTRGIQP